MGKPFLASWSKNQPTAAGESSGRELSGSFSSLPVSRSINETAAQSYRRCCSLRYRRMSNDTRFLRSGRLRKQLVQSPNHLVVVLLHLNLLRGSWVDATHPIVASLASSQLSRGSRRSRWNAALCSGRPGNATGWSGTPAMQACCRAKSTCGAAVVLPTATTIRGAYARRRSASGCIASTRLRSRSRGSSSFTGSRQRSSR